MKRILPVVAAVWMGAVSGGVAAQSANGVPRFEVDAAWPKPLPNNWIIGQVAGVAVDKQDHIWILQRPATINPPARAGAPAPPPRAGTPAPPVIEFDQAGNVLQAWGGPGAGYEWPANEHGLLLDPRGNVWVTGGGAKDALVVEFTSAGKFVLQIGQSGKVGSNNDPGGLDRPTGAFVDVAANEVYITDGEVGGTHRRVMVFDATTGAHKRHWGAYGERPTDGPATPYDPKAPVSRQFGTATHCVRIAKDGLVYICDRSNNRIQVFQKNGTFVKEGFVARDTVGLGSIWDLELSPDEKFIFVGDGANNKIWILQRDSLQVVGSFSETGTGPGQLNGVNAVATDAKGNLYTAEAANGARVQKFSFKGM